MNSKFMLIIAALTLSGCGATLPILELTHQGPELDNYVGRIAAHVQCELRHAIVRTAYNTSRWPVMRSWAAKIELTIHSMDTGVLGPSISNVALPFTIAATGNFETDGTRELSMTYLLPFDELVASAPVGPRDKQEEETCEVAQPEPISGHLGIKEGLQASLTLMDSANLVSDRLSQPFDTITEDISFQILYGGTLNPSWKFTNVSVNNSGSLLSATRTHSDHLIITMGPSQMKDRKEVADRFGRRVTAGNPSNTLDESFFVNRLRRAINSN